MEVYVLDTELNMIGIIDTFNSLIWANRYVENGDCELYLKASTETLNLLRKDYYLMRLDDDMVCRIKSIVLSTDAEQGNYLTVHGYDTKSFLDQRIIWNTMTCNGKVETFMRNLITKSLISPDETGRKLTSPLGRDLLALGTSAGFNAVTTEQVSYRNLGEKLREYCRSYGWGIKITLDQTFEFSVYKGQDKTDEVVFSDDYENLISTEYSEDDTNLGNVALSAGQGEGSKRLRAVSGDLIGTDRYEIFVDAKDLAKEITFGELKAAYPMSSSGAYIDGTVYKMHTLDIQIIDASQLAALQEAFPTGTIVTIDGIQYYRVTNVGIADLPSATPTDEETVVLRDVIYSMYLLNRGYEKLKEYGSVTSFSGQIEPNTTFTYKRDYNLGDIVTIENEFGISIGARIVEIVEVEDENGYRVEPKFEYIQGD